MSFSQYTCRYLLDALFGNAVDNTGFGTLNDAPVISVGLSSADPGEDGTGLNEPSGGSYARVATTAATWNNATNADPSVVTNTLQLEFPTATADWVSGADLTHAVLFDASSNVLGSGALSTAKPILSGDTARFAADDISISLD